MSALPTVFLTQSERDQAAAVAAALAAQLIEALQPVLAVRQALAPPIESYVGIVPYQQLVDGTTPDAGEDYVYVVPGAVAAVPLSVYCEVTTSGVAGDRYVAVEYRDGNGDRYVVAGAPVAVSATSTQAFCWHPTAGTPSWPVEDAALAPLPQQPIYGPCQLAITVFDGDAGDQISNVRVSCEFTPFPFR